MPFLLRYFILLFILLSILLPEATAQRRRKPKIWEGFSISGQAGANHFFGDLVDNGKTNVSLGAIAEKEMTTYLSARASIMGGAMSGTQLAYSSDLEYAYFNNIYTEFNIGASFRPLNLMLGYYKQRTFNPYFIGQIGMTYFSATEYYGAGSGFEDGSVWREKSGITPTVAGGGGLSFWVNSQWSVNIEAIGTLPFSDELDGHSEWYHDGITYQTDANDFYYTTTIGLKYLINDSKWKNEPKYNRKAYLKTRSQMKSSSKRKIKSVNRKRRKRR